MKKRTSALSLATVVMLAIISAYMRGHDHSEHEHGPAHLSQAADFVFETDDLARLVEHAEVIVVARSLTSLPGRTAYSSNRESGIHFELAEFDIEQAIKGANRLRRIVVERAHSHVDFPDARMDLDGGPYESNSRYLLFLKKQPESTFFYLVNTDARYEIDPEQRLRGIGEGQIARMLHAKALSEVTASLQSLIAAAP